MAFSALGGKFKGVISKDQDLLDAAKIGNVETIGKLTSKKRHSTASQLLPSFLKGSVNINCADREGYTPLHHATLNGHKSAVECLLNLDASLSIQDNSGCTPLHLAAWKGYDEICLLFLKFPNGNIPIDLQNSLGDTALHMAAQYGYTPVVSTLLQYNADTSIRNLKDESALDLAAQYGRHEVVQLLVNKNPDLVKHTITSHSPLHLAAACGHVQIISTLLENGFDINTKTTAGTALHTAAMFCKTDVVKLLIESGIDLHALNLEGKTALEVVLQNDQTQHKFAEIAKYIRDHIMTSEVEGATEINDGNVYEATFIESSASPPPAPKVEETVSTEGNKSPTETKDQTRPVPKPRVSLGETQDDRKSAMYSKPDKDKNKIRIEEAPPSVCMTDSGRISAVLFPDSETDTKEKPDLPKKHKESIPPLPPKVNDVPLLPPKVLSPTADMVVADLPPTRIKSQELLEAPKPCEGATVEVDSAGGYFDMTGMKTDNAQLSPLSPKRKPVKPPRKKSPAPVRKNETSPVQVKSFDDIDNTKEDYEVMSNVKKVEDDKSFSEDVYRTLFSTTKTDISQSKISAEATPADYVPCDPVYTNMSLAAEMRNKISESSDNVPFTKYRNESKQTVLFSTTDRKESNLTETREEIYQNISQVDVHHQPLEERTSTGFQQVGSFQDDCGQNGSAPLTSVIESDRGAPENCDKGDNIPESLNGLKQSDIGCIPKETDIPSQSLQNECNIPHRPSQSENNIPCESPQSGIPDESLDNDYINDIPSPPKSCQSGRKSQVTDATLENQTKKNNISESEQNTKKDSYVPQLPPKPGGSDKDLSKELASAEKRISNGSVEAKSDVNTDNDCKVPKPPSLEFTQKRTAEHKFPVTPTGYPQPPTPDFPPPSPNTALKGIEQKIAGIEVPSKRRSRDIETITEDLPTSVKMDDGDISVEDLSKETSETVNQKIGTGKNEGTKGTETTTQDIEPEEPVVMRRSTRLSSSGSGQEVLVGDDLEPFAGLLRGSVIGGPRKVISQIYENAAIPHKKAGAKRTSLPLGNMTFEPVMEREEDVVKSEQIPSYESRPMKLSGMKEDGSFDDKEEWDQIANIMASFGAGIDRESVFVEKFEALFTKHLAGAGSNIPVHSVGEWLEALGLGQYENTLYANGFDDTDFLGEKIMEDQDLELIGITTVEHRKKILDHAKLLPQIIPISTESPPESVEAWLNSLRLPHYLDKFMSHKYDTMERVQQVWELELSTVLDISSLGHRKRILASLGDRSPPERQFSSLKKKSRVDEYKENKSPFKDINLYKDYTKVKPLTSTSEEEINKSSKPGTPSVDNSDNDEVFQNNVQGKSIKDTIIYIRPPHQANTTASIKQWRHRPEMLIKGCCNYTAQYLGSTLVRELTGTSSTIEGITKLKKSADAIAKIPTIMLSISYRGVKFIDAKSKKVICDHEIVNIFCACQDAENMNFFAYITRDNETGKHYCHVFSVRTADLAREVIMTLGEAFEVAYQMAQKEKAAAEAKEFERTLSQSDADDSSQSKSSSKASINTV